MQQIEDSVKVFAEGQEKTGQSEYRKCHKMVDEYGTPEYLQALAKQRKTCDRGRNARPADRCTLSTISGNDWASKYYSPGFDFVWMRAVSNFRGNGLEDFPYTMVYDADLDAVLISTVSFGVAYVLSIKPGGGWERRTLKIELVRGWKWSSDGSTVAIGGTENILFAAATVELLKRFRSEDYDKLPRTIKDWFASIPSIESVVEEYESKCLCCGHERRQPFDMCYCKPPPGWLIIAAYSSVGTFELNGHWCRCTLISGDTGTVKYGDTEVISGLSCWGRCVMGHVERPEHPYNHNRDDISERSERSKRSEISESSESDEGAYAPT